MNGPAPRSPRVGLLAVACGLLVASCAVGLGHRMVTAIHPRPSGLAGSYFANDTWSGAPIVEERDPAPSLERVLRGSIPVSPRHFSVRWTGWLAVADAGPYRLTTSFDDVLEVEIDGRIVVPATGHPREPRARVDLELPRGAHPIAVRYANRGADFRLEFAITSVARAWPWTLPPTFHPPSHRPRLSFAGVTLERLDRSCGLLCLLAGLALTALAWPRQHTLARELETSGSAEQLLSPAGRSIQLVLRSSVVHALVLGGLAVAVLFTHLSAAPVARHDEDTHTRVALETADSGGWWPLVYHGLPYVRKPPLKLWLSVATFRWIGSSEFWVRAWDASFGVLTVLVTYALGRRERGGAAGFLAGCVLLTSYGYVFHHGAREGVQDSAMILGFTLALALATGAPLTARRATLAALALIATSLIKPAMGLVPLGILIAHRIASGRRRELARAPFRWMSLAAVAAPLAWQLAGWLSVPGFVEASVGGEILGRISGTTDPWHAEPWWYYLAAQPTSFAGWWPVALAALAWEGWRAVRLRDSQAVLAVVWPVALFAAVSCMRLKLAWYVYPAYPVLAISIGSLAVSAIGRLHRAVRARVPALTVVAIALLVALVVTRLDATITRSNRPGIPILVQRWVAFLSEPTQASWRLAWLDLDPGLDLDDPTFYYLHRLRDRTERFADAEALGVALEREPDRPTLVLVGPRYPLPATLAARSVARMTLAMPYGAELTVLAFGALDPARIPLRRS